MPRNTKGRLKNQPLRPNFVRAWRQYRRLSQDKLAAAVGITSATLSRIERALQPYNQRVLEPIAVVLKCTPADLIERGPTDVEAIMPIWMSLKAQQRRRALRVLEALADETEDAA